MKIKPEINVTKRVGYTDECMPENKAKGINKGLVIQHFKIKGLLKSILSPNASKNLHLTIITI